MARKKKPTPPTVDEIFEKFRDAETFWKPFHSQAETGNRIFSLKLVVDAPQGYNVIYPGTGNSIVMTAADHIAGDAPKVSVPEAGLTKRAQERSEALEKGFQAALYRFDEDEEDSVIRTLVIDGLWSGMIVAKGPIFDASAWGLAPIGSEYEDASEYEADAAEYETTKMTSWPFLWQAVDPR